MKISITGASGFIGKALCDVLRTSNHEISILTRQEKVSVPNVCVVKGDLLSESESLQEFVDDADAIFHCAGEIKNEDLMEQVHVEGTKRLLSALGRTIRKNGKPVHWVQLSSVGAYGISGPGTQDEREISEQSPEQPVGVYEFTKTVSDRLVREFAQIEPLFSFSILRPTVVIGSQMPNQSFHAMARMIKRGYFFRIGRHKQAVANYVHVEDVIRALIRCLTDVHARGKTFIVSNDCPLDLVISALARSMDVPVPSWVIPESPLRLLVRATSPWLNLPLTTARIDAMTKQTHYSTRLIEQTLSFYPLLPIVEVIPRLVAESRERLALK
jgi:nucleoside-diphosphate-sugar epimerase